MNAWNISNYNFLWLKHNSGDIQIPLGSLLKQIPPTGDLKDSFADISFNVINKKAEWNAIWISKIPVICL